MLLLSGTTQTIFLIGYLIFFILLVATPIIIVLIIIKKEKKDENKKTNIGCDIECNKCNMKKCPNNPNNNPPEE